MFFYCGTYVLHMETNELTYLLTHLSRSQNEMKICEIFLHKQQFKYTEIYNIYNGSTNLPQVALQSLFFLSCVFHVILLFCTCCK